MEAWIEFGRGPLFRITFALMVLGLGRILVLTSIGLIEAYRRNPDRIMNWREVRRKTLAWLVPANRLWRQRPVYSSVSYLFHVGLIVVPIFLAAHIVLWRRGLGVFWPSLPQQIANDLTLIAIVAGLALFAGRFLNPASRGISRRQDYFWLLLLLIPFVTGYACSNLPLGPRIYERLMLLHVYSADLIFLLIPFTKIAHCVLAPLSQVVTAVAWKFPAGAGERVIATLGYADKPAWLKEARLNPPARAEEVVTK